MVLNTQNRNIRDIQALFRSRLQIQILLALAEGNKTLAELREITGSSSQALIPRIRKLEASNLIAISEYEYHLTSVGKLLGKKMLDILLYQSVAAQHKAFWDQHIVEEIPEVFLATLGDLHHSEIIADTNVGIFNVYFNFLRIIQEAEQIFILTPISSPEHMHAVMKRIRGGAYVETLLGKELFTQLSSSEEFEPIRHIALQTGCRIYTIETPPKLALTVTNKHISLGLYRKDGVYDTTTDLFSADERAVAWGRRLYRYYQDTAEEVIL